MIKNFVLTGFTILILIILSPQIKGWFFDFQMSFTVSSIDMSVRAEDQVKDVLKRVGDGHRKGLFTPLELSSIDELSSELKTFKGKTLTDAKADRLVSRIESIADRYPEI